jgi:hypothetical protein
MTIKNFRIIEAKQSPPSALTDTERAKQDLIENLRDRPLWDSTSKYTRYWIDKLQVTVVSTISSDCQRRIELHYLNET